MYRTSNVLEIVEGNDLRIIALRKRKDTPSLINDHPSLLYIHRIVSTSATFDSPPHTTHEMIQTASPTSHPQCSILSQKKRRKQKQCKASS